MARGGIEIHDLAISKYVAGREKDLEFTRALAKYRLTNETTLFERISQKRLSAELRTLVRGGIDRDFPRARGGVSRQ